MKNDLQVFRNLQGYSVYVLDNKPGAVIPKSLLLDYFSSRTLPKPIERQYTEDDFIGWRDADGYLVLPKDWYDEDDDT